MNLQGFEGILSKEVRLVEVRERTMLLVEAHVLRRATIEFRAAAASRPFANHAVLAWHCFARAVGLQPRQLLVRRRKGPLVALRQQCMTFVYLMVPEVGIAGTARLFKFRINTARFAILKYREPMLRAIRQAP